MGTRYQFNCHCGYSATVAGDYDVGPRGGTATILCRTCKRLLDVRIAAPVPQPPDSMVLIKPDGCPRGRNHDWRVWTHPGPCPRCGATMKLWEMLALWD
jgi:hypothetical protein